MSAFDENRDGFLNRNEINDQREFQGGDFNRDGALNRAEFARVDSMLMKQIWESSYNHFLFIDPAEFNLADTNRDGLVDSPEFARSENIERGGKEKLPLQSE